MNGVRKKYDQEFKKNAVKLSHVSPKTISELCGDPGISDSMPDDWRQRYASQGDKTRSAAPEEEVKALRLENAELKMERDMLKKAAAYFGFPSQHSNRCQDWEKAE